MKLKGLGRRLYNIFFHTHTVAGITISAALFIIFYAGSFALFREEIFRWENPTARGLEPVELEVEKTIAALRAAEPNLDETKNITIRSGHEEMPFGMVFGARTLKDSTNDFFRARVDPAENYTVTIVEEETTTVGNTLYRLHYFGQIPVIGLYLSGLVALFFLFATITGVMIHWRNIVSKFYAFSTRGKWKQIWTNAHTVLGMIGLPFQIVYAVTGAFYGILILLLIPSALILFGGDNNKVIAAVRPAAAITVSDSAAIVDFSGVGALIAEA
ncbi:MAG: PepSY-associated TM helix domain-containing protein, partial [Bacteroidota bacterium]